MQGISELMNFINSCKTGLFHKKYDIDLEATILLKELELIK